MYKITDKKILNKDVELMDIEAPLVAKNALPGQFIILRVDEFGERIPLTIVETKGDIVTIIYQKLGYSTNLLSTKEKGDFLEDFVGPLGKATHLRDVQTIIAVAGGVGAAPLYPQLVAYHKRGVSIDLVIGARTKEHLLLLDKYQKICDHIYIATDDGSAGTKGFVTTVLKDLYQSKTYDLSIAIGPLIMMKNTVSLNDSFGIETDVSLNPIMIDGTGMCGNCRVSIEGKTYFACIDGPDFPSKGIDFDELIARQTYYTKEEHDCNLKLVKK